MANELKKVGLVFTEEGAIDFKKTLQDINLELSNNYNQFKLTQSQWDSSTSSTEKLRAQQEYLANAYQIQQDRVNTLKMQLEELENSENKNTTAINKKRNELTKAETKLQDYNSRLKEVDAQLSDSNQKLQQYGKKITDVSKKISDIGNKASVISAGAVASGTVLANNATNLEDAVARYAASTNIAEEETEKYKKVLENINNNNYGDGYEDIANSMSQVTMQFKNLDEQGLQNITEKAIALRDLFGYDVSESVRAVKAMMDNLNVTADEAFNLIAEGKKQGLDFSNELLDNINEYSVQFGKLGLSAEDMFNIFKSGADNGAFNLDKIGDAVKEFSIRVIDGSNTTVDGFKRIGLNADTMAKKFANGGDEAKKAFVEVVERLGNMDDKVSQNIAGVDLFGTMWEDLGPTVITSFSKMDNGISKSSDSMQKSIDQLYNTTKQKAEAQLKRLQSIGADFGEEMLPVLEDLIDMAESFTEKLEGMSDAEKENIVKLGLFVAAVGPVTKTVGAAGQVIGNLTNEIGTFAQAIGVAAGKTNSANASVNNLANVFKAVTNPIGIASLAITAAISAVVVVTQNANKEINETFSNMGESATDFIKGIGTAESHLSSFNSTLFASAEEQQKLQENMDSIQAGITQICKLASDERRGYTQEEITQLDEYFTKLRELKDREIQIQTQIAQAITQQATTNAQSFQGSLEEYKIQSQEWIKTAQDQKNATIKLIEEGTIEEIALLNQRYATEDQRNTEAYQNEYNKIMERKQAKIDSANDEVAQVSAIYANGYLQRSLQDQEFEAKVKELNTRMEEENKRHNDKITEMDNSGMSEQLIIQGYYEEENQKHTDNMKKIWKDLSKGMSDEQISQLGTFVGMVADAELYGGKLETEAQSTAENIVNSYDEMPDDTRKIMQETMSPMLDEMEKSEPSLFAKATGIANGILSRLRKAFDIHSPSRKTRQIMRYAMQPMEEEMDRGKEKLFKEADEIGNGITRRLKNINTPAFNMNNTDGYYNRSNRGYNNRLILDIDYNKLTNSFITALKTCKITVDEDGFAKFIEDKMLEVM